MSLGSSVYEDWDKTVSYLQDTLIHSWLTVRVYFQDFLSLDATFPYRRPSISRDQNQQTVVAMYERIFFHYLDFRGSWISSLSMLNGIGL